MSRALIFDAQQHETGVGADIVADLEDEFCVLPVGHAGELGDFVRLRGTSLSRGSSATGFAWTAGAEIVTPAARRASMKIVRA